MAITLSTDGYCAASDVAALLQQLTIDANSDPSTTEVEGFITQYFGELGGMLVGSNYVHPVAQAGGSLTVSAGNIVLEQAAYAGDLSVRLTGSGGTLSGVVRRGDFFTIANDAQRYGVLRYSEVDDDGDIGIWISPGLELDAASGAVVTYTAGAGAANVLKRLNALGAAVMTVHAAYGPDADEGIVGPIIAERDRLWDGIATGAIALLGADKLDSSATMGTARLLRA